MTKLFTAIGLLSVSCGVYALGEFSANHLLDKLKIQECRSVYALGNLKITTGETTPENVYRTFLKCTSEAKNQIANTSEKMASRLKSSSQRAAAKEYRIAINLALEGSEPKQSEPKFLYDARLVRLDEDVERAWQRLVIE